MFGKKKNDREKMEKQEKSDELICEKRESDEKVVGEDGTASEDISDFDPYMEGILNEMWESEPMTEKKATLEETFLAPPVLEEEETVREVDKKMKAFIESGEAKRCRDLKSYDLEYHGQKFLKEVIDYRRILSSIKENGGNIELALSKILGEAMAVLSLNVYSETGEKPNVSVVKEMYEKTFGGLCYYLQNKAEIDSELDVNAICSILPDRMMR